MNNLSVLSNPLKRIVFMKIHYFTVCIRIDCITFSKGMCSNENILTSLPKNSNGSALVKILKPPDDVKGIKRLDDKSIFNKTIRVPVIYTSSFYIGPVTKIIKPYMLKLMAFQPVKSNTNSEDDTCNKSDKYIVLNPDLVSTFSTFDESVRIKLNEADVTESSFGYTDITVTFDNWKIEDLIEAVLPNDLRFSGYSMIGHIVHFNLRKELLDYKYILGEIILNKIKIVRTVVNKLQIIDNTYRNFQMELICGENDMVTKSKENNCIFEMDFSKVYWNSRLSMEHERIIGMLKKNDVLYDVFAGIGPFAIPAAKKGCLVLANDLNPDSYHWLKHNAEKNKVIKYVRCFNDDAKVFITMHIKNHLLSLDNLQGTDQFKVHIAMNLPAMAFTFLNDFRGLFTKDEYKTIPKDIICHLYCFVKEDDLSKRDESLLYDNAKQLVETQLQTKFTNNLIEVKNVRNVAPNKDMFRVSFKFEPEFLIRQSLKRDYDSLDESNNSKK